MLASFLSVPVSVFLIAGTVFCLTKAFRGSSWVAKGNYVIHALMALGKLGMVWHSVELPLLPQLLLFGVASFWFLLQAVSKAEFPLACHTSAGRISGFYHAAMLAAMVFMLVLPHPAVLQEASTLAVSHTGHVAHAGHVPAAVLPSGPAVSALWIQPATQLLAVLFAIAVLIWLLPMGRVAASLRPGRGLGMIKSSRPLPVILERSYEAGAALAMSLMFGAASM